MTVNKGLLSLVENVPNFSNQALENAVDTLKVGWVIKSSELDTDIQNNTVLTTSQKNDLKDDINNVAHLNLGRVLGDLVRHSATIIDASIIPLVDADNPTPATFLEILQNVQSVQGLVPELHGVPASNKSRAVNDHLGTLNNIFVTTEDSTAPVFTSLLESINFIVTANLATETALENSNLTTLSTYIETLSDNISYSSLAEDVTLRTLMSTVAQDTNWQNYFTNYADEKENLNPIYTTDTDSDKSAIIDQVLADSGLPDVTDATDLAAVAAKAQRDTRIDTANYDRYTVEQQITKSCEQLGITTANRTITALSGTLLRNMNQHDRDEIARQLDSNESANTLS